jgi:pimeloyl-ACP methyl ester carboxylesterase
MAASAIADSGWTIRSWCRVVLAVASLAIGCSSFTLLPVGPSHALPAAPRPQSEVYLFRGLLNVFSLGMDDFSQQLARQHIPATVWNHTLWRAAADDAVQKYRQGGVRNIVVIGHSLGAGAVVSMVEYLGQVGIPVSLAVTLDGPANTVSAGRVTRFVNLYISTGMGGPLGKGGSFSGPIANVDLSTDPNIGHLNIDKSPAIHAMLQRYIAQAIRTRRSAAVAPGQSAKRAPASPLTSNSSAVNETRPPGLRKQSQDQKRRQGKPHNE